MGNEENKKIRLLILTQKLDKNDDVLGFMHGWIAEFAKKYDKVIVIALGVGEVNLPENVEVLSLGKERDESKIKYVFNFYKYIWRYKSEYDHVLVHMNKEYMVLGGLFWRLWGKKTALWYNHAKGNIFSVLAGFLSGRIFYTSPFSFFSKWPKAQIMPTGINVEIFKKNENIHPTKNSILYLGRLSPIKNVHILIEAANLLDKKGVDFLLNLVGEPGEKDGIYFNKLKGLTKNLEQKGKVKFWGKLPNFKTPEIYNQNMLSVNLTNSGSFDKTILETMACERLVLVSNESLKNILPDVLFFQENSVNDLAKKLEEIFNLSKKDYAKISQRLKIYVFENHDLGKLAEKLITIF